MTIAPAVPSARITSIACLQHQNVPVRWTATSSFHCSFVVSCSRPSPRMPAFATIRSRAPNSLVTALDCADDVVFAPHVTLHKGGVTFGPVRLFDRPASRLGVAREPDHARALAAEGEQDLTTEPTGGSGDDTPLS